MAKQALDLAKRPHIIVGMFSCCTFFDLSATKPVLRKVLMQKCHVNFCLFEKLINQHHLNFDLPFWTEKV